MQDGYGSHSSIDPKIRKQERKREQENDQIERDSMRYFITLVLAHLKEVSAPKEVIKEFMAEIENAPYRSGTFGNVIRKWLEWKPQEERPQLPGPGEKSEASRKMGALQIAQARARGDYRGPRR